MIARELNSEGLPPIQGKKWHPGTIKFILKNEKYTGDVIFQKTYTDSSFNRHRNNGEYDQYFCENHHEPIISHEDFDKVNELLRQRGKEKGNGEDTLSTIIATASQAESSAESAVAPLSVGCITSQVVLM